MKIRIPNDKEIHSVVDNLDGEQVMNVIWKEKESR